MAIAKAIKHMYKHYNSVRLELNVIIIQYE